MTTDFHKIWEEHEARQRAIARQERMMKLTVALAALSGLITEVVWLITKH